MDIRLLTLFHHLANTLHFGKTAAACYVSPSTLSRAIQRLEETIRNLATRNLEEAIKKLHLKALMKSREEEEEFKKGPWQEDLQEGLHVGGF